MHILKAILWVVLVASIFFFHTWRLTEVPAGLYVDETSIGYNAALISESGQDEHGVSWPTYFEAFGEYKNPVYIYATSLVFAIFGVSEFTLRFTSALFFFWFITALAIITHRQFRSTNITFLTVLSAGFLPYFFPLSRIAFEAVSQLATTTTWLLLLHLAYIRPIQKIHTLLVSLAAGLALGISVYSYSTGRLLGFLFMFGWIMFFTTKKTWKLTAIGLFGFLLMLIPYFLFSISHPGALTSRFEVVTYIHDSTLTVGDKLITFASYYIRHISPEFLLLVGDTNLRHSSGFGGVVFATTLVLGIIGLAEIAAHPLKNRFGILIMYIILVSPIGAALTTGDTGHALRTVTLGIGLVLLLSYGLFVLQKTSHWNILFLLLSIAIIAEASAYLNHYFSTYPQNSIVWFETKGLYPALRRAVKKYPHNIIIEPSIHAIKTSVGFYGFVIPALQQANIRYETSREKPGSCSIYKDDTSFVTVSCFPPTIPTPAPGDTDVACTQEAKICADGSAVGRSGPRCEFTACPETKDQS